jgi:hypothetical protein
MGGANEKDSNRPRRDRRLLVIFLLLDRFFILDEGQQAVVTRFGKIVNTETTAV